jgi:hypothetical protein
LLTFIVIWLIHHWEFVFTAFNFDKYYFLDSKIAKLSVYIEAEGKWGLWFKPLLWTFGSMLIYYFFSSVTEIINIAYHNVRKRIYKKWDNKKLKTIEEFLEKVEDNKKLQLLITSLEQGRETLLSTNESLEKSIGEKNKLLANNRETMEKYTKQINDLTENHDRVISDRTKKILEEKDEAVKISKRYQEYYGKNQDFSQNIETPLLILMAKAFSINNVAILESQQGQNSEEPRDIMEGIWSVKHYQELNLSSYNEDKISIQNRNMYDVQKDVFLGAIKSFKYNKKNKIVSFIISNRDNTDINIKLVAEHKNRLLGFWNDQVVSFQREDVKL